MNINFVPGYDRPEVVRELFLEYTHMLVEGDSAFQQYLNMQHFDDEIRDLEMKYGHPEGRLYLVYAEEEVAGCVALKKIDEHSCEIKRLYVRSHFRGHRIGEKMVERLITDARAIGYTRILLDTLPFLRTAIQMYLRMGFYEIPSYNGSPMENLLYMQYNL